MKKFLLVVVFLLAGMAISATAAESPSVTVNGESVVFSGQQPVVVDARTLVPVRGVFEHLGFTVDWDDAERTAIITNDWYEMRITIGSDEFSTNHEIHTLDVPAQIIGESTMVPIRLPLESVGVGIDWDEFTRTVVITTTTYSLAPIYEVMGEYAAQHDIYLTPAEIAVVREEVELRQQLFGADFPTVLENEGFASVAHLRQLMLAYELANKVLYTIVTDPVKFAPFASYLDEADEEELLGAQHILVTLDEFDDEAAAMEFATELWERATGGEDFSELIATYGRDPGMVARPEGYTFTAGVMVAEFEQGTRALAIGEISEPISAFHGIHIIKRVQPNPDDVMRPTNAPTREQQMAHAVILGFEAKIQ